MNEESNFESKLTLHCTSCGCGHSSYESNNEERRESPCVLPLLDSILNSFREEVPKTSIILALADIPKADN